VKLGASSVDSWPRSARTAAALGAPTTKRAREVRSAAVPRSAHSCTKVRDARQLEASSDNVATAFLAPVGVLATLVAVVLLMLVISYAVFQLTS
jgi:hypothetical protein